MLRTLISILLSTSTCLAASALPTEGSVNVGALPDSIVSRSADGKVVATVRYVRTGDIATETTTRADGESTRTRLCIDSRGVVSSETHYERDPRKGAWIATRRTDYETDKAGRTTAKTLTTTDGQRTRTTMAYDADGRPTAEMVATWSTAENEWTPQKKYEYAYSFDNTAESRRVYALRSHYHWEGDEMGWRLQADRESTDYDDEGRVTSRCREDGEGAEASCQTFTYDTFGRLATITTGRYESDRFVASSRETFTYDAAGRIATRQIAGPDGKATATDTYYYSAKARRQEESKIWRLDSAVVKSEDGDRPLRKRVFACNMRGKITAVAHKTWANGAWADSSLTAFNLSAQGKRNFETETIYDPMAPTGDEPVAKGTTDFVIDEHGHRVMESKFGIGSDGACNLQGSAQYDNTYDANGRLTSTVRIDLAAGRTDSTAYAYDIRNRYQSTATEPDTAASASRFSKIWMRLSGFFGHTSGRLDSTSAATPSEIEEKSGDAETSEVERMDFGWDGGRWAPRTKEVATFDKDGMPVTVFSYKWDEKANAWAPERKDEYESRDTRIERRKGYRWDAANGRFRRTEIEEYHYTANIIKI